MKSARTLITICLLLTAATLFSQMTLMKVNVPFAFGVEDHSLPAGEYLVLTVTPERSICVTTLKIKVTALRSLIPWTLALPSERPLRLRIHSSGAVPATHGAHARNH